MKNRLLSLKASAGTGKTYNLTLRYISLLFSNVNPAEIMALTFTNKAAGEMYERVLSFFESKPLELIRPISEMSGLEENFILDNFNNVKKKFLKSDIHISTIDSFFNRILKKFCWYAGVEYDYEITSFDSELLKQEITDAIIENNDFKDLFSQFLEFENKSLDYFYNILQELYNRDKELNIDFTIFPKPDANNYYKALEKLSELSKYRKNFYENYFENKTPEQVINSSFLNLHKISEHSWFKKKNIPESLDNDFQNFREILKTYFLQKEKYYISRLLTLYSIYKQKRERYVKSENTLDFKDVEHFVYEILKQDNFLNFFYFRLDSKIKHILIDEFQDTSITQFLILKPLIDEIASENEGSFFYVGDTKQAIYRFRGGQKQLFDFVKDKYKKFGLKVDYLEKNFRSRENIIDFVNETFDFIEVRQKPGNMDVQKGGYVEVVTVETENLKSNEKKEKILNTLYEKIKLLKNNGVSDENITILTFTNNDIKAIDTFLSNQIPKIKTVQESSLKLINQRTVRAIISFIKYAYFQENLYLSEALALIGENPFIKQNINLEKTVFETVLNLMESFSIIDDNTRLFLEISHRFKDFDDFIENVENIDTPALTPGKGIRIMTIHKSKGLDFQNVIVVDKLGDDRKQRGKLIFDYNNIEISNIRFRLNGIEKLDNSFKNLIEKEEEAENDDLKNLLYVAFTRPKDSLIVIQKDNGNIKDILNISDKIKGSIIPSIKEEALENLVIKIFIPDIGKQNFQKESVYKPDDFQAIYNGLAIHHFFEFESRDFVTNKYGNFVDIEYIENLFQKATKFSKYKELLNGKIFREYPVKYEELKIIDILIIQKEKAVIIDYKLSKADDISNYIFQVKEYKKIIKELLNCEVEAYLYFVEKLELLKIS